MRAKLIGAIAAAVLAVSMLGAGSASAATEFGDSCAANGGVPGYTFVSLSAPTDPLPLTAPVSGVITRWKSNVALEGSVPPLSMSMQVFRQVGPLRFTVVGDSGPSSIINGSNSFAARIPVQAGDRLGLSGAFAPLYCTTGNAADSMGVLKSNVGQGSTIEVTSAPNFRVPVMAVIEADADNDGYGDETQDACPQSAAFQTACPVITLSASTQAGKQAVTVFVTANSTAPVQVSGTVKLGKGIKATLSAPPQTVTFGQLTKFKLKFGGKLKAKLKELTPKQKLTLKISASATNAIGQISTTQLTAKLKGQG